MPRTPLLLVLATSVTLSGCMEGLSAARERTGFISAVAYSLPSGLFALQPLGAFYRADGLEVGLPEVNTCIASIYSTVSPGVAFLPTVEAGPGLYTDIGGRRDTLFRDLSLALETYQLPSGSAIPFTPGDTLRVEIPGAEDGFPNVTLSVKTAEPFEFLNPAEPAENAPMTVNWEAAPSGGSVMTFSFRYAASAVNEEPDSQIYCVFTDGGTGVVPALYAGAWASSNPDSRSIVATRIRYTTVQVDSRTKVTLLSYFDRPSVPLPTMTE